MDLRCFGSGTLPSPCWLHCVLVTYVYLFFIILLNFSWRALSMFCPGRSVVQGRKYTIERMPEAFGAPKG